MYALGQAILALRPASVSGLVFNDQNADGNKAGEPGLSGWTVYIDDNNNGSLESDSDNYNSTDVPTSISSSGTPAIRSTNAVSAAIGQITDVNVALNISHTRDSDLSAYLISPSGNRVTLFSRIGGSGDHFTNTAFDDEAATTITSGSAPFSGTFRPTGSLADFDDEDPNSGKHLVFNSTSVENSTVDASFAGTIAKLTVDPSYSGSIGLNRALDVGSIAGSLGNLDLSGHTLVTGVDNSHTKWSSTISGSGGLTKVGTGSFYLQGVMVQVAPRVEVMALKFLDADAIGKLSNAGRALDYALAQKVSISSNGWAANEFSQNWLDKLLQAEAEGHLFIASAGNGDPAQLEILRRLRPSNPLVVGAQDAYGDLASFSNWDPEIVDLLAPGVGVRSTLPGGEFGEHSGTSVSTAFAAGLAALRLGTAPKLTRAELVDAVLSDARQVLDNSDPYALDRAADVFYRELRQRESQSGSEDEEVDLFNDPLRSRYSLSTGSFYSGRDRPRL